MNSLLRNFLSALVGIVLYKAVNFALAPAEFEFASEALEAIILAVVVTAVILLFNRWRRSRAEEPVE
jgi:membrane protein DedA with SNARE-associated domain